MATETPFDGDVTQRRRRAALQKLRFSHLALRHRLGLLGLLVVAVIPAVLTPIELEGLRYVLFLMMFAVSWDVVSGYTGQLSFGHAFFFGLGGYGTAILATQHGVHPIPSIVIAAIVAGLGGVLIGVPALRLEGPYLSLVTLIAPLLLLQIFVLFNDGIPYIAPGGLGGLSGLTTPPPQLVGFSAGDVITVDAFMWVSLGTYYIALLTLVFIMAVCYAVTRTSTGQVLTAIREDEAAVRAAGLNPAKFKIFAFVLSGVVGGLAGAVWMHAGGFPNVENLFGQGRIDLSIQVLIMAIIGGMGTIVGAAVGAAFFAAVTELVAFLNFTIPVVGVQFADLQPLPVFLLAMLVLVYMPRGVLPEGIERGRRLLARSRGEEVPTEEPQRSPAESTIEKYRREIRDILGRDDE